MRMPPTTATRRTWDPTSMGYSPWKRTTQECHAPMNSTIVGSSMTTTVPGWVLLLASLAYMAGLLAIAWWGDRTKLYPDGTRWRALIYSFALGVYGSSWTFYG